MLNKLSTGLRLDIEDGLKGKPIELSKVEEAQNAVLDVLRKKVEQGHIIIDPNETIV